MKDRTEPAVLIAEVGPRDGLQNVKKTMQTSDKLLWITALHAAGVREIEVGSFVSKILLPQMADSSQVVQHARTLTGLTVTALVPNLRGAKDAFAAGAHKVTLPLSVSEAHSVANVRKTRQEMLDEVRSIVALRNETAPEVGIEVGLSTAFGCSIQGIIPEKEVLRFANHAVEAGADCIGLSDTTGYANPAQVRRLFAAVRREIGTQMGSAHMHNTRGLGLANCLAALDEGVRMFDASLGGLGGCPFAPGASGNVASEDLVFMFEAMGIDTGIDLALLIASREPLRAGLPGVPMYGMTAEAGIPLGFQQRRGHG